MATPAMMRTTVADFEAYTQRITTDLQHMRQSATRVSPTEAAQLNVEALELERQYTQAYKRYAQSRAQLYRITMNGAKPLPAAHYTPLPSRL